MNNTKFCECINWCRAEQQPFTDKHHKNCEHYNDKIKVVKITHNGSTMIDTDIKVVLASMEDWDEGIYQVEITEMYQRDLDAMPEFQGF